MGSEMCIRDRNNAVHDALALKATTAGVAGDLLPDADGTRDLGSSTKEWQDLFIDGTANIDNASVGTGTFDNVIATRVSSIRGIHVLGGTGVVTISQIPANGLIDAIGSENEALDWLHKTRKIPPNLSVNDVIIERSGQSWRKIVNMLVGKALFSERLNLDGLFSLWQSKLW